MKKLLLIGATDPNGAGLQADWRVCAQLGVTACSVVTAVTAQNHGGVEDTGILAPDQVAAQLRSINWPDIAAIKIGMLGNAAIIHCLLPFLPRNIPLILDPILVASSGGQLLDAEGQQRLVEQLLPRCELLTPNRAEAIALLQDTLVNIEDVAEKLIALGTEAVLITGADHDVAGETSSDYFLDKQYQGWLTGHLWPDRENVRGTGCSLATAIACARLQGQPLSEAVVIGKAIISAAIQNAQPDGKAWQISRVSWPEQETHLPHWHECHQHTRRSLFFPDCGGNQLGIYPVVDSVDWIKRLVPQGVETIQLRIKLADIKTVEDQVKEAIEFCRHYPVRLFINDYWQLAIKHRAYGVHLGQEDIEDADLQKISAAGLRLGLSTHCYREVARALSAGPSYLALGPIYATTSKRMPWVPQGAEAVRHWVKVLDTQRPLVAIGGIDHERAETLATTGVGSVAMISAITQAPDPEQATRELLSLWHKNTRK